MTSSDELPVRVRSRRGPRLAALALLVAALGAGAWWGWDLWQYWQWHESTDDAFVEARVAPVSARVSGTVVEVPVADNHQVEAGQTLVRLDPRDNEVKLEQARAALATMRGAERAATSSVPLTDEGTRVQLRQAQAAVETARVGVELARSLLAVRTSDVQAKAAAVASARAEVEEAEASLARARLDHDRFRRLAAEGLVAQRDLDQAEEAHRTAEARRGAALGRLDTARGELGRAEAELASQRLATSQAERRLDEYRAAQALAGSRRQEVDVRRGEAAAAEGRIAQAAADVREAELRLAYTTIRAPMPGRVTRKTVEVGQVVQLGQPLMAIVSLDEVWIVANFKETQLTRMRPGQRATVTVDAYPGVALRARVDSIQGGTGSRFALLPPENASGNFVKVVQRVPVKLVLEADERARRLLVPGMSVIPTVALR
jgi:membrane fusion protein (multidrug efflux system)